MDSLPPIPTPFPQLWREIRVRIMPAVTFTCVIAALFLMWREYVTPASIIGTAEIIQANIIAQEDGLITQLALDRFDTVTFDQKVGVVTPMEKELLDASLAAIDTDLKVMEARMHSDWLRVKDSYIKLGAAVMAEKKTLANLEVQLTNATFQYNAQEKLFKDGSTNLISLSQLQIALAARDSYQVQIDISRKGIAQMEKDLAEMEKEGIRDPESENAIKNAIDAKRKELIAETKPVDLKAPIAGRVSALLKHPGEWVSKGEAIATISAPTTDRVIAYIRQPLNQIPTTNDIAQIRTRTQSRVMVEGRIIHVGPSMIPIDPTLLSVDTRRREVGLPILISIPKTGQQPLVPGEFVDISIQYASAKK